MKIMNKSSVKASEKRQNFLRMWYREREMDLQLRRSEAELPQGAEAAGSSEQPWEPADAFDRDVKPGDVRLLADDWVVGDRLVYVVIFNVDVSTGIVLVAPFSPYAFPATNAEWLTGLEARTLRVLQIWNAQPFPLYAIAKSWLVGALLEEKLDRARELYTLCIVGHYPQADEREDIGLAIVDMGDARCQYQEEEFLKLAPLHALMDRHLTWLDTGSKTAVEVARRFANTPKPLLAAAADGDIRCSLLVKGLEAGTPLQATRTTVVEGDNGAWSVDWNLGPVQTFEGKLAEGLPVYAFADSGAGERLSTGIIVRSGEDYVACFQGTEDEGVCEKLASPTLLLVSEATE